MKLPLAIFGAILIASSAHAETWEPRYDASHIDHKQDANWRKTVDRIMRLSAIQNHGHISTIHTCYAMPDNKAYCATTVWYTTPDGKQAFIRVIRRGDNDHLIARDVCRLNKTMSYRICVNFDDGYTSKWIREKGDTNWKQIEREDSDDEAASGGL